MKKIKMPETDSVRELADFWDKNDLADFEEDLEEVKEKVFDRSISMNVHLEANPAEPETVKYRNAKRRVGYKRKCVNAGFGSFSSTFQPFNLSTP